MKVNSRAIAMSLLLFLGVVLLFIFAGKFALGKISEVRAKIAKEKKSQTVLTQKLDLLNQVENEFLDSSDASLLAMPSGNPALAVIYQLKRLAAEAGVSLSGIKAGAEVIDTSGLKRVDISFEATGARPVIIAFLKSIESAAPISVIEKVKINETAGVARGEVSVKSFFADLPEKLPTLNSPTADLTSAERELLAKISSLKAPVFVEVPPSESEGREDPFGSSSLPED